VRPGFAEGARVGYLEQDPSSTPQTVRENVMLGVRQAEGDPRSLQ